MEKKIAEIKLKATEETKKYREEVKNGVKQRLEEFYANHFPGIDCSGHIDEFSKIFDDQHQLLHDYFGFNVSSIYRSDVWNLVNTAELSSELADIPLNHPTPRALKTLEMLHGVTGLVKD
jgi:hypothetical protein